MGGKMSIILVLKEIAVVQAKGKIRPPIPDDSRWKKYREKDILP